MLIQKKKKERKRKKLSLRVQMKKKELLLLYLGRTIALTKTPKKICGDPSFFPQVNENNTQYHSTYELAIAFIQEWEQIVKFLLKKLIKSMRNHVFKSYSEK